MILRPIPEPVRELFEALQEAGREHAVAYLRAPRKEQKAKALAFYAARQAFNAACADELLEPWPVELALIYGFTDVEVAE